MEEQAAGIWSRKDVMGWGRRAKWLAAKKREFVLIDLAALDL